MNPCEPAVKKYGQHHTDSHNQEWQKAAVLIPEETFHYKVYHCNFPLIASVGFILAIFLAGR